MPRSVFSLGISGVQATANPDFLAEIDSDLTDASSLDSPVEIDLDPFDSGKGSAPLNIDLDRFSAQSILPLELLEMIAIKAPHDSDLRSLTLTCKDFAAAALERSTVWRARFLARYDHPMIAGASDFRVAYQLREMVLGKFPSFKDGGGARGRIALEVLRDMILESYHGLYHMTSRRSKNLHILSSPGRAPYMYELLSSPFYAYGKYTYGKPNRLFDALQIVFSHLLLHPRSEFAVPTNFDARITASRDNYDLGVVYLHDAPLKMLYHGDSKQDGILGSSLILDLNALLHIRNFWHGHLASFVTSMYADGVPTYGRMAATLLEQGRAPQQWDKPFQESSKVPSRWFGHYSCTHPTPRKLCDIEEHQTCAEDWINQYGENGVHPLTLDIVPMALQHRGWWPSIFANIPILESALPDLDIIKNYMFLRGIAPFLAPSQDPNIYSAYGALRIRGIMHPLPEQEEIPGWNRIIMVFYQPTPRYLLAVLDENSPNAQDDHIFDQSDPLLNLSLPDANTIQGHTDAASLPANLTQTGTIGLVGSPGQTQNQTQATQQSVEEAEAVLQQELEDRQELKGPLGPMYLTSQFIAMMEDNLHPPEELSWEDLSYAYVYEGVVIPGGKMMMGRYWRAGPPSSSDGFELGDGADRGPWLFWC